MTCGSSASRLRSSRASGSATTRRGKSRTTRLAAGSRLQRVDFSHEAQSTLSRYFWGGGLRSTRGNLVMQTLQARCLGGGSVFNSAICMRAPDFALERWNDADGLDLRNGALDPHYDRIEDFWKVRSVPPEIQGRRNELFGLACDELGWAPTPIQRNEEGCKGSGRCFTGCLKLYISAFRGGALFVPRWVKRGYRVNF